MGFNAATFAQLAVTEASATEVLLCPAGEYDAFVQDYEIKEWRSKDNSKSGLKMSVKWRIIDPTIVEIFTPREPLVRQELMFDLTEDGGLAFGPGLNVGLGRLREAVDLNKPGATFSFDMLKGQSAKVKVSHRADPNDPTKVYSEVKDVARA